jgi:hypothetical protein
MGLGASYDNPSTEEENRITPPTPITANKPRTPITKEHQFKTSAIVSDLVYRVQGIPVNYKKDNVKELLVSKFELDSSLDIDIRSLARSQDQRTQTAIISFSNVSSTASFKGNEWSFRWYLENNKISHIKLDTHFIGLTMLSTPDSTEHSIE